MHEPDDPDGAEDTRAWPIISQVDDHAGQFRSGQPDTAARRKPGGIGQLTGGAKHHRRMGWRPLTAPGLGPAGG